MTDLVRMKEGGEQGRTDRVVVEVVEVVKKNR